MGKMSEKSLLENNGKYTSTQERAAKQAAEQPTETVAQRAAETAAQQAAETAAKLAAETPPTNLPVAYTGLAALSRLAEGKSGGGSDGTILKYNKGSWLVGDKEVNGARVVARSDRLREGWRKWYERHIVDDTHIGFVVAGYVPPARNALGDHDEAEWELGPDGKTPNDPWVCGLYLDFICPDFERWSWAATSGGSVKAVLGLNTKFVERCRFGHSGLPIVVLETDRYLNKRYGGMTDFPVLQVVDWTPDRDDAPPPPVTPAPTGQGGGALADGDDGYPEVR